ncbi:MAG: M48 family metalloprotease [Alphaproteobacteria bacterium]|nr:M48 family metalloprotease [Alphaproteobacteria bacterium]
MSVPYPSPPQGLPEDFTRPDAAFRRRVVLVFLSILAFLALYVGLLGFIVAFVVDTIQRVREGLPGDDPVFEIILSIPLSLLAVFLIKGLFTRQRHVEATRVEVTEADEPELFAFIHRIADDAHAPRPHRVFLTPDVNASVSYESSVLGLFLPMPKNLTIGLGLVNNLSLDELTAVLAHEFGHFSQSSMRLGTWVYRANQVIVHMVNVRDWWDRNIDAWSRWDLRVSFPAWILKLFTWVLREGLAALYETVNRAYLALSREMEFHADRVSVSITGSDSLVHALARLPFAEEAMSSATSALQTQFYLGRATDDLFAHQAAAMAWERRLADDPSLGATPARPMPPEPAFRVFTDRRVRPPAMWASHPPDVVREARAKAVYVPSELMDDTAWVVFGRPDHWRRELTRLWYRHELEAPATVMEEPAERMQARIDDLRCAIVHEPRFREVYDVGRALLWAPTLDDVLGAERPAPDALEAALDACYDDAAAALVAEVRDRRREVAELIAVASGDAEADDGTVVVQGETALASEAESLVPRGLTAYGEVRDRWVAHLRHVRATHLAIAATIGVEEEKALGNAVGFAHYVEHASARVRIAFGAVHNVMSAASGKQQLEAEAFEVLRRTLVFAHQDLQRLMEVAASVTPPDGVLPDGCDRWSTWLLDQPVIAALALGSVDGHWVGQLLTQMRKVGFALDVATERSLAVVLAREDEVVARWRALRAGQAVEPGSPVPPPPASFTSAADLELDPISGGWPMRDPGPWPKGSLWQRYGKRVGAAALALTFLGLAAVWWSSRGVTVYVVNGFDQPLTVDVGGSVVTLDPHEGRSLGTFAAGDVHAEARFADGTVVEASDADPTDYGSSRVVWNPAGSASLVTVPMVYGSPRSVPDPKVLPVTSWQGVRAQYVFTEPPSSISTKGSGEYRLVLSDVGGEVSRLGMVEHLVSEGRTDEAYAVLDTWLAWSVVDRHDLATVRRILADTPDRFVATLDRAIARRPDDADLVRARREAVPERADVLEAADRQRLADDPDDALAWYLVSTHAPDGAPEGLAALDKALALDPTLARALSSRAERRAFAGDVDGARADLDTLAGVGGANVLTAMVARLRLAAFEGHTALDDVTAAIVDAVPPEDRTSEVWSFLAREALRSRRADVDPATLELPDADEVGPWVVWRAAVLFGRWSDAVTFADALPEGRPRDEALLLVAMGRDDGDQMQRLADGLGDDVVAWADLSVLPSQSLALAARTGHAEALAPYDAFHATWVRFTPVFTAPRTPAALAAAVDGLPAWHRAEGAAVAAILLGGDAAEPLRARARAGLTALDLPWR